MAIQTEKPIECVGCNTFDMKSLFDNSDCSLPIEQFYATRQDAEGALEYFTLKARDVESEPCQIQSEIQQVEEGYVLYSHMMKPLSHFLSSLLIEIF